MRAHLYRLAAGVQRQVFDRRLFGGEVLDARLVCLVGHGFVEPAEQVRTVLLEEFQRLFFEQVIVTLVHGLNLTGCQ